MQIPKVEQIMLKDVLKADKNATLLTICELMDKHRLGGVVIVDKNDCPIGIVTERDIIKAIIAYKEKTHLMTAGDIMSAPLVTVSPDDDIEYAFIQLSLNRIRRIPVIKDNKLVGIVSYRDISNALRKDLYKLQEKTESLEIKAITDPLTGLYNKTYINEQLKSFFSLSKRTNQPMAIIMIDIDHFKNVNDTYGHLCGDEVLKKISTILKEKTREINVIGRYGGEEFIILGPISDHKSTYYVAERIRNIIENTVFYCEEKNANFRITISAGIAVWNNKIKNYKELLKLADDALYLAKRSGRNQVRMADEL
ncbi:MAG: GGDEF domain-containing protein [Candidatus Goldbacteria bacterium]|nr:GGDEF domain-containing protein [Candidatus Goldiibacteriota bacterium]